MKKLFFVFLMGQLLILSYIFNTSIYEIYELNSLGDTSLDAYIVTDFSGDKLNELYSEINKACFSDDTCQLQLIKTPVSNHNLFIYDIYHSQIDNIHQPTSISTETIFNYYPLTKEDFVDSNGVFYTDLSISQLNKISKKVGITTERYSDGEIVYSQIVEYNLLNLSILLILTLLVLFIYTFTRIKVNAIKKMLGYSKTKMINASLKEFIWMECIVLAVTIGIHFIYYLLNDNVVPRYFILLVTFSIVIVFINTILLLCTQISLRFIDINLMIKNKVYSNRLNAAVYAVKILLMLSITVSISFFMSNYTNYKTQLKNIDQFTALEGYYTSNGFNYEEDAKARRNPELIFEYGKSIKKVYDYFDEKDQLYVNNAYVLELLTPGYLEMNGLNKEDVYNSIQDNHLVVNERYVRDFMKIKDENGIEISNFHVKKPTILVPVKYKEQERTVKEIYVDEYNMLLNYNELFGVVPSSGESTKIDNLEIIYIENNQEYELLGQNFDGDKDNSTIKLKDTILMMDQGDFGSLYYYDLLNASDLYFHLEQRDELSQVLAKYGLTKIVNVGTLLTPYMDGIHFVEYMMYNAFVFTILFLVTLLFVIYISNYIDVVSNSRRYTIQYIYGYHFIKTFKTHLIVYSILLCVVVMAFFIEFNIVFYILMLLIDFIILLSLYKKNIKNNVHTIIKGG